MIKVPQHQRGLAKRPSHSRQTCNGETVLKAIALLPPGYSRLPGGHTNHTSLRNLYALCRFIVNWIRNPFPSLLGGSTFAGENIIGSFGPSHATDSWSPCTRHRLGFAIFSHTQMTGDKSTVMASKPGISQTKSRERRRRTRLSHEEDAI
jgi:hypothetical protein